MARKYTKADLAALRSDPAAALPAPKRRNNEESVMQRALIRWWQVNCRHFGVPELCLFSIPNGGNGDARRGSIMKAEGQRKGAPDLFLAASRTESLLPPTDGKGNWRSVISVKHTFGLFLELKTARGQLSPEQEVFHELLRKQGYKVVVCRSLTDCINQITSYLT